MDEEIVELMGTLQVTFSYITICTLTVATEMLFNLPLHFVERASLFIFYKSWCHHGLLFIACLSPFNHFVVSDVL